MKCALACAVGALVLSAGAEARVAPALPAPVRPVSEVSTNIALNVDFTRLETLSFTLSLEASPTNNLALSVGVDENGDGRLSLEEADVTFGYDCGAWFLATTETGSVVEDPAPTSGPVEHAWTFGKREANRAWDTLRVIRRGFSEMNELVLQEVENQKFAITIR